MITKLRVFTLLVFALETGKEDSLTFVRTSELNGSVAHLVMATLGTFPLNDGSISLVVLFLLLLLDGRVLQAVEVDDVGHNLLVKQGAWDHVLADYTGHVPLGGQTW